MTRPRRNAAEPSYEEASRFLSQAGFGGTIAEVEAVREAGLEGWFLSQLEVPSRSLVARLAEQPDDNTHYVNGLFWRDAIHGADPLRRRVAYALSQIVVVSLKGAWNWGDVFAAYADILAEEAFGNYGALLRRVTYSPAMAAYLGHLANEKADPVKGTAPDENYARELMQLFTIGLVPLTPGGEVLPGRTYSAADVEGLAAIMTGLTWAGKNRFDAGSPRKGDPRRLQPMDAYPIAHETGTKRFLGYEAKGPNPIKAIDGALDHLMAHPNIAPFVSKLLIQRLVTSNPAPAYVERVGTAFAEGRAFLPSGRKVGEGTRGDMVAVIAAILFDDEARRPERVDDPLFGRVREPSLRYAHLVRAFRAPEAPGPPGKADPTGGFHRLGVLGEQPWHAPSVFGSYDRAYLAPGSESQEDGLVAPELQTVTASTVAGYLSKITAAPWLRDVGPVQMDPAPLLEMAGDGAALADHLFRSLAHGAPPPALRARLNAAFERLPVAEGDRGANARKRRVAIGLTMLATDPSYAVQR